MTPAAFLADVLEPGLDWCARVAGVDRDRPAARRFLLAVAGQESGLVHRAQVLDGGRPGPARGFFQFEQGCPVSRAGVSGVLLHRTTAPLVRALCVAASVEVTPAAIWRAIEGHDRLAVGLARLLLLTDPAPIPGDERGAWDCYAARLWRPGKPHPAKWAGHWLAAGRACGL